MMRLCFLFLFVHGAVGDGEVALLKNKGENVTLHTGINKTHDDVILWYFNNFHIALVNGDANTSCLYDGKDKIFRNRLQVDYETGSLTIKDMKPEHTGRFEADFIKSDDSGKSKKLEEGSNKTKYNRTAIFRKKHPLGKIIKTFNVTIRKTNNEPSKGVVDNGLSSGALAGICFAVAFLLVILAVVAKIYQRQKTNNLKRVLEKNSRGLL